MTATPVAALAAPWRSPSEPPALSGGEVHVWRAALDQPQSRIGSFLQNLAADEKARAERFHFENDRGHFIVARGVLRAILGSYLNRAPEALSFRYGSHGKPALSGDTGGETIRFNLSHSHGVAVYAFAHGREVGIDIEHVRTDLAVAEIAGRFFSRREVAMLRALPAELQRQAFFRCWTRKEAYIKARGEGLSLPLDEFDVSLAPGEKAAILATQRDPSEASRWSLHDLAPAPGYAAALAVEGQVPHLACWQYSF